MGKKLLKGGMKGMFKFSSVDLCYNTQFRLEKSTALIETPITALDSDSFR